MPRFTAVTTVFALASLTGCTSETVSSPPPSAQIAMVSGDDQSGVVGQTLAAPLALVLRDANGNPLRDEEVEWSIVSGGGSISPSTTRTDYAGYASTYWTLGSALGAQSVSAAMKRLSVQTSFSAMAGPVQAPTSEILALHYDGTSWTQSLEYDLTWCCGVTLTSIWGASPSAIFAAGGSCNNGPFVMRYDGSAWRDSPTCTGGGINGYKSIWGSSASDVFAVKRSPVPPSMYSSIAHYDGTSWTTSYERGCNLIADPNCGGLGAVWSRSSTDAIAVGDRGVILRYNGTAWNAEPSGTTANLNAIWGDQSSDAVFSVGDAGTIRHYDGTAWRTQASGTTQSLFAAWGSSPSDVFVVGASGIILHYDGSSWTTQNSGTTRSLNGVWGSSGTSVFAVGDNGTILHYDGSSWTTQAVPVPMTFKGVWGTSPSNVFAVGRN